eukprot:Platyproteum_vivax@DN8424_c0_g1_i1.p1
MRSQRFKEATRHFFDIKPEILQDSFNHVATIQDIALWGSLCALATQTRAEIEKACADEATFRRCLDYLPYIRDIVFDFLECNFGRTLDSLRAAQTDMEMDVHLTGSVQRLLHLIARRMMALHFEAFSVLSLSSMSKSFNSPLSMLEPVLVNMIEDKEIDGRLDLINQLLVKRIPEVRSQALAQIIPQVEEILEDAQSVVLKAHITELEPHGHVF